MWRKRWQTACTCYGFPIRMLEWGWAEMRGRKKMGKLRLWPGQWPIKSCCDHMQKAETFCWERFSLYMHFFQMCNNWQNRFLLEMVNREIEWEKQSRRTEFQVFWSGKAVYCKLELVFNSRCWQRTGRKLLECGTIVCAGSKFKLFSKRKEFEHSCSVSNNEKETTFRLISKKGEIIQTISFSFFKNVNCSEEM